MTKKQRRHLPEQIIRKLAEGHKLMAAGMTVEDVCREFGIAESSWHRWLNQYEPVNLRHEGRRRETVERARVGEHDVETATRGGRARQGDVEASQRGEMGPPHANNPKWIHPD